MIYTANEIGFYKGRRIRAGQSFEGPDNLKGKWFTPVGKPADVKPAEAAEAARLAADAEAAKAEADEQKPADVKTIVPEPKAKGKGDKTAKEPTTFSELTKQDAKTVVAGEEYPLV